MKKYEEYIENSINEQLKMLEKKKLMIEIV